ARAPGRAWVARPPPRAPARADRARASALAGPPPPARARGLRVILAPRVGPGDPLWPAAARDRDPRRAGSGPGPARGADRLRPGRGSLARDRVGIPDAPGQAREHGCTGPPAGRPGTTETPGRRIVLARAVA